MEKQLYDLKIDPVFESAIDPLDENEYESLKANILKNGCTDPLMAWHGFVADGHNRLKICREYGIPFAVEEVQGCETKEDVLLWMYERALGRRNMSDYSKTVIALKQESILAQQAEMRMKAGKKADPPRNSAEGDQTGETRDRIAKLAGKGHDYVSRVKKLEAEADPETRQKLRRGEITVNKAYTELFGHKQKPSRQVSDSKVMESDQPAPPPEEETAPKPIKPAKVNGEVIPGMGSKDGFTMHTAGGLADVPESADAILFEVETALTSFELSIQDALERYTRGMASKEVNEKILSMLKKTTKSVTAYATKYLKEVLESE